MRPSSLGVTTLVLLVAATSRARAECKPAAVPIGDPALVRTISDRLTANGVETTASEGCPAVRVQVEQRGQQLVLRVTDGFQRRGERSVQDLGTAAALIESWTLQEIELGSMPPEPVVPADTGVPVAPVGVTATTPWLTIAASGRPALQNDGSMWLGGAASGCMRIGRVCVGASVGYMANKDVTNDHARGPQRSQEIDTLALVDLPVQLGRFTLSPGLGLGYGWQRFAQQHLDAHMLPFSIEYSSHALRGNAHVTLSRPLGPVALFAELFADASLLRTEIPSGPTNAPRARGGLSLGVRFEVR